MPDAVVIPFPTDRSPTIAFAAPLDGRLAIALQSLQAALAEQAEAVQAWRFAMAELGVGVAALGQAMVAYDGSLSRLDLQLTDLRSNAGVMEARADGAMLI